jgi:2-aminoadipate transaminase
MSDTRPVVVYGASGFSGRLIVEFLREYDVPFVAAGRNRQKLEEVLAGVPGIATADYEIVQVEHDVDALASLLDGGLRPKLLYTIPDHQNPAGITLSPERRAAVVGLARRYGFLVVEDVAYRELGFDGSAPPSLWSSGPDVVVQAGTTSKTFFPGVRLGWAAGPAEIVAQLVSAKQNTDQCAGALGQRLFEEYVRRGWIDEQLERSRALYARKCARLLDSLAASMPDGVAWTTPRGGFFSWLTVPGDATELARRAADEGVAVVPGALFYPDGRGGGNLRLSFSMVDESLVATGIERLASLLG